MKYLLLVIGLVFFSQLRADQADEWYNRGSTIFHQIKQGKIQGTSANWNRAIRYFEQAALAMNPGQNRYSETYYSLGLCQIEKTSYLKAIATFRQIVKAQPNHRLADDALYLIGYCFLQRGEKAQATLEYERVVFQYPNGDILQKALNTLDEFYKKKPNPKREIVLYQHIIKKVKNSSLVYIYQEKLKKLQSSPPSQAAKPKLVPSKTTSRQGKPKFIKLRVSSAEISSRIVIEFDQLPEYKFNLLTEKQILYIDFLNASMPESQEVQEINNGIIQNLHLSQFSPSVLRLSLAITTDCNYHIFSLDDPSRIVADLSIKKPDQQPPERPNPNLTTGKKEVNLINQLGLKVSTIIIDAGHGGKDPGTSHTKMYEKAITLEIAEKLAKKLGEDPEFQVILTRDLDKYLALEERTELGNSSNGDLFISLHVNSAPSISAYGIETYYLSLTQDIWAQQLAARENATTLLKIADLNNLLSTILINSKIDESIRFARIIHQYLVKETRTLDRGIKKAPFIVLIGANMPSVLVEIGFISNKDERRKLSTEHYKKKIVDGLFKGIKEYAGILKKNT